MMNKDLTELVFILDRSGSMHGLEEDTIGGFNSMIDKQRDLPGEALISTVLFNHETEVFHDRVPLIKVPHLTQEVYSTYGSTALLDAVGGSVHHITTVHRYAREEDVPGHTLFVITTDGLENASHRYSHAEVKRMIEQAKEKFGWEFLFLGANIDAVKVAGSIGISRNRASNYNDDSEGTRLSYGSLGDVILDIRKEGRIAEDWSEKIEEDVKTRKKKR